MILEISAYIILWMLPCLFINIVLMAIFSRTNIAFKLKLRKSSKYIGKQSPIYKIEKSEWYEQYNISKWELGYEANPLYDLLFSLCVPYPIEVRQYKYCKVGTEYGVCTVNEINYFFHGKELSTVYEENYLEENEAYLRDQRETSKLNSTLYELNDAFNKNYIK